MYRRRGSQFLASAQCISLSLAYFTVGKAELVRVCSTRVYRCSSRRACVPLRQGGVDRVDRVARRSDLDTHPSNISILAVFRLNPHAEDSLLLRQRQEGKRAAQDKRRLGGFLPVFLAEN